jgi:carotenoid 1,2-hydratase
MPTLSTTNLLAGPGMRGGVALTSSDSHSGVAGIDPSVASERWAHEARRHQRTPGAYEWWYFDAVNAAGTGVTVALFEGLPFHPTYLKNVNRYQLRPMSNPFDAVPRQVQSSAYLGAYIAVFEHGKRVAQGLNVYAPEADEDHPEDLTEIRVGPNRITIRQDGTLGLTARVYPYRVKNWRPRLVKSQTINVSLNIAPTFAGGVQHVRPFRAPGPDGATHVWALSAPHATVTGTVQHLDHSEGVALADLHLNCVGYHDHLYGQGGLGHGMKKIRWGYLQGDDWVAAWHHSPASKKKRDGHDVGDGVVLLQRGRAPVVIDGPAVETDLGHLSRWMLRHPGRVTLHGSDTQGNPAEIILRNGSSVSNAPFYARSDAQGSISIPGRGTLNGRGVSHTLKLSRLRWPVMSDLVLMAIQDVRADDPLWRQ